jgi:RNA polymerase sigma-70 factor, ECF subfamily
MKMAMSSHMAMQLAISQGSKRRGPSPGRRALSWAAWTVLRALLHDDVTLSMPPSPTWIAGRADVARFFANRLMQALRERRFRAALVDANGGTGAGFYLLGDDGAGPFFALQVLETKDGRIRVIDHFTTARSHAVFFAGGLARTLTATPG